MVFKFKDSNNVGVKELAHENARGYRYLADTWNNLY